MPDKNNSSIARAFGDLKVRPKLMVLHNLFFLVLTCAAYFTLIPLFEKEVANGQDREVQILEQAERAGLTPASFTGSVSRGGSLCAGGVAGEADPVPGAGQHLCA